MMHTRIKLLAVLLAGASLASACSVHRLSDDQALAAGDGSTRVDDALGGPSDPSISEIGSDSTVPGGAPGAESTGGSGGVAAGQVPGGPPTANSTSTEKRVASDQGVTADQILLGILHTSASFTTAAGGGDVKPVGQIIDPFIKELNDQGGINGRKVVPKISEYDPLSAESMQTACVQQAEDHKVFSSIAQSGFYGEAEVCMATKRIPLLTGNTSSRKTNHDRERGWVRQTGQNKDRNQKNWIDYMIRAGLIGPQTKTGLIYVDVPEDTDLVKEVVLPYLKAKGLPAPVTATLSASIAQTPSESQAAVLKFRGEGVTFVLPLVSFLRILIFAEQADAVGYKPGYSVSDFGLLATDAMAGMPPSQWEGVTGVSMYRTGENEPGQAPTSASFKECNAVYEKYGQKIAQTEDGPNGIEVAYMMHYCEHIALYADVARRAGVNPTRETFLAAVGNTGTWTYRVTLTERLTFSPSKYDGADLIKIVKWKSACTDAGGCYREAAPFFQGAW